MKRKIGIILAVMMTLFMSVPVMAETGLEWQPREEIGYHSSSFIDLLSFPAVKAAMNKLEKTEKALETVLTAFNKAVDTLNANEKKLSVASDAQENAQKEYDQKLQEKAAALEKLNDLKKQVAEQQKVYSASVTAYNKASSALSTAKVKASQAQTAVNSATTQKTNAGKKLDTAQNNRENAFKTFEAETDKALSSANAPGILTVLYVEEETGKALGSGKVVEERTYRDKKLDKLREEAADDILTQIDDQYQVVGFDGKNKEDLAKKYILNGKVSQQWLESKSGYHTMDPGYSHTMSNTAAEGYTYDINSTTAQEYRPMPYIMSIGVWYRLFVPVERVEHQTERIVIEPPQMIDTKIKGVVGGSMAVEYILDGTIWKSERFGVGVSPEYSARFMDLSNEPYMYVDNDGNELTKEEAEIYYNLGMHQFAGEVCRVTVARRPEMTKNTAE